MSKKTNFNSVYVIGPILLSQIILLICGAANKNQVDKKTCINGFYICSWMLLFLLILPLLTIFITIGASGIDAKTKISFMILFILSAIYFIIQIVISDMIKKEMDNPNRDEKKINALYNKLLFWTFLYPVISVFIGSTALSAGMIRLIS